MWGSLAAESVKLRKRPATWIVIGVWIGLTLLFGYLFPYLSYLGTDAGPNANAGTSPEQLLPEILPGGLVSSAIGGFPMFGGALALILGALSAGGEYGWGTLKTAFVQRPGRLSVYGGKLLALSIVLLGAVLTTFALSAVCSALIAAAQSRAVDWPAYAELGRAIAGGWLVVAMWGMLGVLFGIIFRGTALSVGLGLVWVLVVENLVAGVAAGLLDIFATLRKGLPGANAGSLVAALGARTGTEAGGAPGVVALVGGTQATIVLIAYILAFALVAALVLRRTDVS